MRLWIALLFSVVASAQTAVWPGSAATDSQLLVGANLCQTRLSQPINDTTSTTIFVTNSSVTSPYCFVVNQEVQVDNEFMKVTSVGFGQMTVTRGFDYSTASTHQTNAPVVNNVAAAWYHNALAKEIESIESWLTQQPIGSGVLVPFFNGVAKATSGSNTLTLATSSDFPAAWRPVVSIIAQGAACDGNTDDSAALVSAVGTACSAGGSVYVPASSNGCKIASPVSITSCSNIKFYGEGKNSKLLFKSASPPFASAAIAINSGTNIEVDHIYFQADNSGGAMVPSMIFAGTSSYVNIHDVWIDGSQASAAPNAGIEFNGCDNSTVKDSVFLNNGWTGGESFDLVAYTIYNHDIHFRGNTINGYQANVSVACYDCDHSDIVGNTINENNFEVAGDNNGYGILSYRIHNGVISTVARVSGVVTVTATATVSLSIGEHIQLAGVTPAGSTNFNVEGDVVSVGSTTFTFNQSGVADDTGTGGTFTPLSDQINIAGNMVSNAAGTCIYMAGAADSTVIGNRLKSCGLQQSDVSLPVGGIALNGVYRTAVSGNTVNYSPKSGIRDSGGGISNTYTGNTLTNIVGRSIDINGTGETDIAVVGNTINNGSSRGIYVNGTSIARIVVDGNTLNMPGTANGIEVATGVLHPKIVNNMLFAPSGGGLIGIAVTNSSFGTVMNNSVQGWSNCYYNSGSLGVIKNNYCRGSASVGMDFASGATNNLVDGNYVRGVPSYGMRFQSGANYNVIRNNYLYNNSLTISYAGTGNVYAGNTLNGNGATPQLAGTCALVAGTCTVSSTEIVAADSVVLSNVLAGGTLGILSVGTITGGTSFVINSSSSLDTSTVYWQIQH